MKFNQVLKIFEQSKIKRKIKNRSEKLVVRLLTVMSVVCECVLQPRLNGRTLVTTDFSGYVMDLCATRGVPYAVKRVKELRGAYLRLVAVGPSVTETQLDSLNSSTDGSVTTLRRLGFLPDWDWYSDPEWIRACLSILSVLRFVRYHSEPELGHIEAPWVGKSPLTDSEIRCEARRIARECQVDPVRLRKRLSQTSYSATGSAGLYGPALLSATRELPYLPIVLIDLLRLLGWEVELTHWVAFKEKVETFPSC